MSVSVSSTVYNLAGDEAKRPNYLKTTVAGAVMSTSGLSIGDQLRNSYMKGPGIKLRQFGRWCRDFGFTDAVGMRNATIAFPVTLDPATFILGVPHSSTESAVIQKSFAGSADYHQWAERYMVENHPDLLGAYSSTYNTGSNTLTVTSDDHTVSTSFTPVDYDVTKQYLYVEYQLFDSSTSTMSALQMLIYKQDTGNSGYDAILDSSVGSGTFLPYIPLRLNNQFVSSTYLPDIYTQCSKALKKSMSAKIDDIIAKIADNSSLSEIDYAYVVFGVSLNVQENACRRYIYEFFKSVMQSADLTGSAYASWEDQEQAAYDSTQAFKAWQDGGEVGPAPTLIPYPSTTYGQVSFRSDPGSVMNFAFIIDWTSIIESIGTGLKKPDAVPGELWFEVGNDLTYTEEVYTPGSHGAAGTYTTNTTTREVVYLHYQVDTNNWKTLTFYDLTHRNYIYEGNAVGYTAKAALTGTTESGFIIPLHEQIFRKLSLTDETQMSTACCFLMFNSVVIRSTPWYASSWFQVFLVAAVLVVTVATAGAGTIGLLGANAAIGGALGFEGTIATIVGATANALAAMLLVQVIQIGATSILGNKLGAIIGAVAAILALQVGSALAAGGNTMTAFESLMRVDNLLKLTDALGKGFASYVDSEVQDVLGKTSDLISDYNKQTGDITALYEQNIGFDQGAIDPLALVDVHPPKVIVPSELPSDFFNRTLMTGSEISDLSMNMITKFTDVTLSTDMFTP